VRILENIPAKQRSACAKVAQIIADQGGRALLVGGCVRDGLMEIPAKDVDIEVYGLTADTIEELLKPHFKLDTVGRSFGVFILKGVDIDLALPRKESKVGPKHTDFVVEGDPTMSPKDAAARRDFTINAISFDPLTKELLDPYDGVTDLKQKQLCHVSPAFAEDPLRVLRGMQFVARFDLEVAPETISLCQQLNPIDLPAERLWEEWKKLLLKGIKLSKGLQFLKACNWLQYFPELEALVGCHQDPKWHPEGDVWNHTCHCLDAFAQNRIGDDWEDTIVGLATLCHDLGKPTTSYTDKTGRIRSPQHDVKGVPIAQSFLERLTRQKKVFEEVLPLVEQHMRPLALYRDKSSDSAVRRLAARVKRLDRLVRVSFADKSGRPPIVVKDFPEGDWLLQKATSLKVKDSAPAPLLLGRHLIKESQKPGPEFSKILDHCYEAQLDGTFKDEKEGITYLKAYLDNSPLKST